MSWPWTSALGPCQRQDTTGRWSQGCSPTLLWVLQRGLRGLTAALAHLEQKAWKTLGQTQKSPPVLHINTCSAKKSSANSLLSQLNTEKQQGGKGALTSSASLPHSKDALLKSGKLALSPKKSLVNSSILTERALIPMQRARPGSALWRRVPIPNFPGSHSSWAPQRCYRSLSYDLKSPQLVNV